MGGWADKLRAEIGCSGRVQKVMIGEGGIIVTVKRVAPLVEKKKNSFIPTTRLL